MTIREIIKAYLADNGYDGLCGEDCGCEDCIRVEIDTGGDGFDWIMHPEKPA